MPFQSTKTFGHDIGISACFRQWRATHSHCSLLHGYALSFKFVFEADHLDDKNWVMDFGGLKDLKAELVDMFDHKLMVAGDDPQLDYICSLSGMGIADVRVMPGGVGCEKFAEYGWHLANKLINQMHSVPWDGPDDIPYNPYGLRVVSCEVAEHGANSAIYYGGTK